MTALITPPATTLAISSASITPSSLSSGGFATLSVTLNGTAPVSGAAVSIQTSNSTAFPAPSTITVPAGQSTNGVSVQAGAVTSPTNVIVTATYGGTSRTASVTINPSAANQVLVTPTSWQPQFTAGDPSATLPFQISSQTGGTLTGTVTANSTWLTVNGHASYNWVAPEGVNVTANPAGMSPGIYTGSLTITSLAASNSPVSVSVTMTILAALRITTASLPNAVGGQSYNAQLQATGGSGYTWSLQDGRLPTGLTLSPSGLISGVPTGPGSPAFNVGLQDAAGRFTWATLSITFVQAIGISFNGPSNYQFAVGTPYGSDSSLSFSATGGTPPFSWSATAMPPGLSVNPQTGIITGTPTQPGTFSPTITATDSQGRSANKAFTLVVVSTPLTIKDVNGGSPPSLPSGTVGSPYNQFLVASGGSQSNYTWRITGGSLPPGITAQNGPGCPAQCALQLQGTPTQAGSFSFSVQVSDQLGNTGTASVTLFINAGTPPTISAATLPQGVVGQPFSVSLSATGGATP